MIRISILAVLAACGAPSTPTSSPPAVARDDLATVPLLVEGHRPFVEVTFHLADGKTRPARFLVDTGGGGFLITEPLAKELGLSLGETQSEEGSQFAAVTSSIDARIDRVALQLDSKRVLVAIGETTMLPRAAPGHADGMLPGHVLAHYQVVFDYPRHTFTIGKPGTIAFDGTAVAMPVAPETGFPRTEIEVDGKTYGMLLDTGASFTMVSQALLEAWGTAHGDWKRQRGAAGDAATLGGQTLETMFVPAAKWAGNALAEMGVVSQQTGVFEKWMSSMMSAPIVGSLAGNVLEQFRVELDYPGQKLYVRRP